MAGPPNSGSIWRRRNSDPIVSGKTRLVAVWPAGWSGRAEQTEPDPGRFLQDGLIGSTEEWQKDKQQMGLLTLALIIDMFVGDPDWLWKRLPHPVVLIGKWINLFDRLRDHEGAGAWCRRIGLESRHVVEQFFGIVLLLSMFVLCLMFSRLIMGLGSLGWLIELILVAILVAQRSLYDHVGRVVVALKGQGLQAARKQVSLWPRLSLTSWAKKPCIAARQATAKPRKFATT